jgi:2-keto-3-deoxy-L-rhamnonate aldolase RhmA
MLTLPSAAVAEILADAGFEWLFVDCEHGPMDVAAVQSVLQAVGDRCACVVRVPECSEGEIKRILDAGAQGIIVPQVNSAEQAAAVVRACRYPPLGNRGVGIGRAQGYGARFSEYVAEANNEVVVIVQAEHRDAVAVIDEIVAVPGVDCVLIGPYDLSASMNRMGQIHDAEVTSAIERVLSVCRESGLATGYFGVTSEAVEEYRRRGCRLLVSGVDVAFLSAGAQRMYRQLAVPQGS